MTRWGFSGELAHSLYIYCRLPGVESTDETVKLSHYVSAVSVFAVARPGTTGETITGGTDESVPYERLLAAAES